MSKPTRLRPSQGGRFREVRPPPELVAQIRATEDQPRAIFFKGWDLEPPKAPGPTITYYIITPEEGAATKVIDVGLPPGTPAALADFNAWVDVCTNGAQWEIDYVLAVQWPRASGSNIGQAGEPLGLAVLDGYADARYHLTDRGRAALAAGRAHYAPDKG